MVKPFPARAGVIPTAEPRPRPPDTFPRTRGDDPTTWNSSIKTWVFPRMRGGGSLLCTLTYAGAPLPKSE